MTKPTMMMPTATQEAGRPWNDWCARAAAWPSGDSSGAGPIDSGATALTVLPDGAPDPACSVMYVPLVPLPRGPVAIRGGDPARPATHIIVGRQSGARRRSPHLAITSRPRLLARTRFRAVTRLP